MFPVNKEVQKTFLYEVRIIFNVIVLNGVFSMLYEKLYKLIISKYDCIFCYSYSTHVLY